jgi:hypothetical protein
MLDSGYIFLTPNNQQLTTNNQQPNTVSTKNQEKLFKFKKGLKNRNYVIKKVNKQKFTCGGE